MADACCAAQTAADSPVRHACPACGVQGCAVELLTVKAQLTETALARINSVSAHFHCSNRECVVAYFDAFDQR